jgi:hypothetical protein
MPTINRSNWRVAYLGGADGSLRLGKCDYAGVRAIHSATVPFVYVDYAAGEPGPFTDTLVCEAAVEVRDVMNGFDLKATYNFGEDYRYDHVWRFHDDGQFGSAIVVQGPGEEIRGRHTYHLPFRLDLDLSGSGGDSFQKRSSANRWVDVAKEGRQKPTHVPDWDWRVVDKASGRSAKVRARVGDDAEVWALRYKQSESLASIGATETGVPGSPGSVPAIYDDDQIVQDVNLVLWYIGHISAHERVAACGPWVELDGYPAVEPSMPDM